MKFAATLLVVLGALALRRYLRRVGATGKWTAGLTMPILPYEEEREAGER